MAHFWEHRDTNDVLLVSFFPPMILGKCLKSSVGSRDRSPFASMHRCHSRPALVNGIQNMPKGMFCTSTLPVHPCTGLPIPWALSKYHNGVKKNGAKHSSVSRSTKIEEPTEPVSAPLRSEPGGQPLAVRLPHGAYHDPVKSYLRTPSIQNL